MVNSGIHSEEYTTLRAVQSEWLRNNIFQKFNAHGIGIGLKVTAGKPTDQLALVVFTQCKLPLEEIPIERRVPERICYTTPDSNQELTVVTDVIEAPIGGLHMEPPGAQFRPVPGGVRCSTSSTAGTIGGWVWDKTDDTIVMLSNNHVFGQTVGTEIFQPSTSEANRIGRTKRSVPVMSAREPFTMEDCNFVDAAIGEADNSDLFSLRVLEIGAAVFTIDIATLGMSVEKFGQITGYTQGIVTHVDYATYISFPTNNGNITAVFCDLIRIEPAGNSVNFSSKGDSGSLVFRSDPNTNSAVGLHFGGGGSGASNWSMACRIGNVFAALNLDVLCSGGFSAFLDALSAADTDPPMQVIESTLFNTPERHARNFRRLQGGLARDVQNRLRCSELGRQVISFVDRYRAELLTMLVRDGDVRRATISTLRPLLKGSITTDDVLLRKLCSADIERIERLIKAIEKQASKPLLIALKALPFFATNIFDKSLAEILNLNTTD